ncbi:MAG: LysM domain-containing protein [Akkermansia sp.]|nr:LysM domain-containing protein [Akkermansia sp.]
MAVEQPKPAPEPVAVEQPKPKPAPEPVAVEQPKPAPAPEPAADDSGAAYHILAKGESPATVAKKYKIPLKKLMEINHFTDKDVRRLQIGQKIKVKP